ncbi:MAG: flagellar biosynthetic protein FliO [Anaeromyxobacter sp.]|nr:flagellar biosynthetic protein FliO [Anaeromyxobacter sp.]MBL0275820.1 flagellar biosynthetic protein FliO [Anaeromyxobacter sp.]
MSPLTWPAPRPALLLLGGAALCGALAFLPGELGPLAARAGLAAAGVGAVAALARRRGPAAAAGAGLRVTGRAGLGRAAAVALVEVDGRRFLLGVGEGAPELLAELEPAGQARRAGAREAA